MRPEEYEIMYRVEDDHWWYQGMGHITRSLLDSLVGHQRSLRILDAGCGTGTVLGYLANYGTVMGLEFAPEAIQFCRQRGRQRLVRASVTAAPYADNTFDLITSFDVLSDAGVADDGQALRELARVLKPGGWLLLRLPAYTWLRGQHDSAVLTVRRYTRRSLQAKLRQAGFVSPQMSYANMLLFPLAVLKRLAERLMPQPQHGSDLTIEIGPLNKIFYAILSAEAPWVRSVGLPFGLTVVAWTRKT